MLARSGLVEANGTSMETSRCSNVIAPIYRSHACARYCDADYKLRKLIQKLVWCSRAAVREVFKMVLWWLVGCACLPAPPTERNVTLAGKVARARAVIVPLHQLPGRALAAPRLHLHNRISSSALQTTSRTFVEFLVLS